MTGKLILLAATLLTTNIHAKIDKSAIDKLESTAGKLKRAKIFLSDDTIKKKIKQSMIKDRDKWQQARVQYRNVVKELRECGVVVKAPNTLDELMHKRAHLDADAVLLDLANKIKHLST